MSRRLLLASMRNEPAGLVEVSKLLSELKDAWAAIGQNGVNTYENLRSATQRVAA
jgi:flagellin-specific chaperone FliS